MARSVLLSDVSSLLLLVAEAFLIGSGARFSASHIPFLMPPFGGGSVYLLLLSFSLVRRSFSFGGNIFSVSDFFLGFKLMLVGVEFVRV